MTPEEQRFPALFEGPTGETIVFMTISPERVHDIYHDKDGRGNLVSMTVLETSWHGWDSKLQQIICHDTETEQRRIVVWRDFRNGLITVNGEIYEYVAHPDLSTLTFFNMPDQLHEKIKTAWATEA